MKTHNFIFISPSISLSPLDSVQVARSKFGIVIKISFLLKEEIDLREKGLPTTLNSIEHTAKKLQAKTIIKKSILSEKGGGD